MKNSIIPYPGQLDNPAAFSRRDFLSLSAAAALGSVVVPGMTGCGPVETPSGCLKPPGGAAAGAEKAFEASSIGSIRLGNRIIRSAVTMNGYDALGRPTGVLLRYYEDLARGGAGAVVTGMRDTGMMIRGPSVHHRAGHREPVQEGGAREVRVHQLRLLHHGRQ
jgi:hypothetical protein